MGRVMVETWLSAHRGQMPDAAWRKRVDEWTPEVSARSWERLLSERSGSGASRVVLLVAEESGDLLALVLGRQVDESDGAAEIDALYVSPARQGGGLGRRLLQEAARELSSLGAARLSIGVLSANLAARAFYEAMGGRVIGERVFDEEGHLLLETVYEWPDITALLGDSDQGA